MKAELFDAAAEVKGLLKCSSDMRLYEFVGVGERDAVALARRAYRTGVRHGREEMAREAAYDVWPGNPMKREAYVQDAIRRRAEEVDRDA